MLSFVHDRHDEFEMSQQQQWGAQPPNAAYGQQPAYTPGVSQPYAQQYNPGPNVEQGYGSAEKTPHAGGRFKPENRVRDPVFLVLFWLQVRSPQQVL